jgi:phosphatidylserine decarboxylase
MHKEGRTSLVIATLLWLLALWATGTYPSLWMGLLFLALTVVYFLIWYFFRNPKREISITSDDLIYAPADGKVVVIEKVREEEFLKTDCQLVSIFMSPLNVHVNRAPISGEYTYAKYHKGKFLVAWHPKSSTENERTSIAIKGGKGTIFLRQIAGALARRIVMYAEVGKSTKQGEDLGFIKFGSRVDIYLPLDAEIKVGIDQVVKGNKDVIASW